MTTPDPVVDEALVFKDLPVDATASIVRRRDRGEGEALRW
jgi:hypothetical protein